MADTRPEPTRVLMISPTAFAPDWEGNRKRVRQIKEMFEEFGFEVHFLFVQTHGADVARMSAELGGRLHTLPDRKAPRLWRRWYLKSRLGAWLRRYEWCNLHVDDWYFDDIGRMAADVVTRERIRVVVCEYIFYSKALLGLRDVVKVIDAHDVFADRYRMFLTLGQRPAWYSTTPAGEREALMRSDFVLAIQAADAKVFAAYGHRGVHALEYVPVAPTAAAEPPVAQGDGPTLRLCFLGSANDINVSALQEYLRTIHPALRQSGIDFEMVVIGAVCERFKDLAPIPRVTWRGRVEDLGAELAQCDVLVNSLAAGTGLPIKVLDGLSHHLHVIGSPGGVRGLPLLETLNAVHVCNGPQSWIAAVQRLVEQRESGIDIRQLAARDYARIFDHVSDAKKKIRLEMMARLASLPSSPQ